MNLKYILIQAIGFVGTGLFFISFQCRDTRKLFRVQFFSYLFYTLHFLLLGAVTGGFSYILNTVRSFCLQSKYDFLKGRAACAVICVLQFLTMIFTWDGWISVLPVVANIASTIGGYTHNAKKIRIAWMFINSPLWIIYDIAVGSWAGVLDEVITEASAVISIVRYGWSNLDGSGEP